MLNLNEFAMKNIEGFSFNDIAWFQFWCFVATRRVSLWKTMAAWNCGSTGGSIASMWTNGMAWGSFLSCAKFPQIAELKIWCGSVWTHAASCGYGYCSRFLNAVRSSQQRWWWELQCMHVLPSGIECGIEFCFILLWENLRNVKTYQDTRCIMSMIPGGSGPTCNEIIFPVLHWSTVHYTQDFPGNPRTSKVQLSMAHLLGTLDRLDSLVLCLYPFTSYIASIHVFFWPKRECEKHPKIWWLLRQPCESTQKKWCHLTRKMFFGWHNWIETHMDSWYPIGSSSCCSGPNHRSVAMLLFLLLPCRC